MSNPSANRWLRMASLYFILGVCLGVGMAASPDHDFRLMPVHAHLNLLGWVSAALIGLLHYRFPAMCEMKMARVAFWFYQIGLPGMMVALATMLLGGGSEATIGPVIGVFSMLVLAAVLMLVRSLWKAMAQPAAN